MTNQQCAAEFEIVWNGSHTGGNEDLFRKPTAEEQKQPDGYDKDRGTVGNGRVMTARAKHRRAVQKARKRTKARYSEAFRFAFEAVA